MSQVNSAAETPIHWFDRLGRFIRHAPGLNHLEGLWKWLRPLYGKFLGLLYPRGLEWTINGTDRVRLSPHLRMISAEHEPAAWHLLMNETKPDDVIADVGANIGVYALSWGRRIGPEGSVVAFEPDPTMFKFLKENVALNKLENKIQLVRSAVGANDHAQSLCAGLDALSYVTTQPSAGSISIPVVALDHFSKKPFTILKIDVEGYEGEVLKGAEQSLASATACPRLVYVELHPWAWARAGLSTTTESIEQLLKDCGYALDYLDVDTPAKKGDYSQLVARKKRI
jgi:FkbM family methyltransferase